VEYKIARFKELLLNENLRQNLVSRKTTREDLQRHIEDSLAIARFLNLAGQKIVDIGSGAGFPGLILGMAFQEIELVLIESDQKKSFFLQSVISDLGINNISVIPQRAEEIGRHNIYRESFDLAISRAVAPINVLAEYAIPLLKVGGELVLWKGKSFQEEIDKAKQALEILGGELKRVEEYDLGDERKRVLVFIGKVKPTAKGFPRRTGIPAKRPL
jgi:16S rRNA (guanine527-N7)-methyltransferase